jgi:dolichol kinase
MHPNYYFFLRKLIHIFSGCLFLTITHWFKDSFLYVTIFIILTIIIDLSRKFINHFNRIFSSLLGPLLKPSESRGQVTGATTLWLSLYFIWILFPDNIFLLAGLIIVFADPLCAIVGKFSKTPEIFGIKTVAGTVTFLLLSFLILFGIGNFSVVEATSLSFILMTLELFLPATVENLFLGVGSAILIYILFCLKHLS